MERASKQQHDGCNGDVREALLRQLGVADADLKLLLAATAANPAQISGGNSFNGLAMCHAGIATAIGLGFCLRAG